MPSSPAAGAYVAALRMLGRRELSEVQVRQRLARKGFAAQDIDTAVARLRAERAVDDDRVAEAIARTEVTLRRRGRLRVLRKIEAAGIARETADRAIHAVYGALDAEALLAAALARRLRGRPHIADQAEFRRLYRYLIGQGFESDAILRMLKARSVE